MYRNRGGDSSDDEEEDPPVVPDARARNDARRQPNPVQQLRPALEYNLEGPLFEEDEFEYSPGDALGSGTQGTVRKAENIMLGTCAVKQMAVAQGSLGRGATLDAIIASNDHFLVRRQALQLSNDAHREFINMHKVSHHDNIVGFRGYLTNSRIIPPFGMVTLYTGLVFEFMAGGTLENMIKRDQGDLGDFHGVPSPENPPALEYHRIRGYAIDIGKALTFLHEKLKIIHRHIHPSNIFLAGDFSVAKLGDFGYARENNEVRMSSKKGAIKYMAPEVIHETELVRYGFKSEVWSFAMLLYAMLCKREPSLTDENNKEITVERFQRRKLEEGGRPILEETYRRAFPDLVRCIEEGWQTRPDDRPDMIDMLRSLKRLPERP